MENQAKRVTKDDTALLNGQVNHADEHEAFYLPYQCFLEEAGKSLSCACIVFVHYNFVRIHKTLKVTPAMAAGVSSRLWEMKDIVSIIEEYVKKKEITLRDYLKSG